MFIKTEELAGWRLPHSKYNMSEGHASYDEGLHWKNPRLRSLSSSYQIRILIWKKKRFQFNELLLNLADSRPPSMLFNKVFVVPQSSAEQQVPRLWQGHHYPGQHSGGSKACVRRRKEEDPPGDPGDIQHLCKGMLFVIHEYLALHLLLGWCLDSSHDLPQTLHHCSALASSAKGHVSPHMFVLWHTQLHTTIFLVRGTKFRTDTFLRWS